MVVVTVGLEDITIPEGTRLAAEVVLADIRVPAGKAA
jgi:hypothetical protein